MKRILQTILFLGVFLYACQEELPDKLYLSTEQQQISAYLEQRADMTMTAELVKRSGYFNLLNSYGRYTFFAPTDNAWGNYLKSLGKNSIADLTDAECASLFDFHVLLSNVNLKAQRTGMLSYRDTTMSGVRHFVDLSAGFSNIVMNKTSKVEETSELPNGYVYTMSEVFVPRPATIYEYLEKEGYSIMAKALEVVGMKDTLQTVKYYYPGTTFTFTPFYTLFAESDAVFKKAGINNLEQLTEAVWNKEQEAGYATSGEALKAFVQNHFIWAMLYGGKLTTTMYQEENLRTEANKRSTVISIGASDPMKPDPVLNGSVKLSLLKSDVSFKNGVVHELSNVLYINKAPQACTYVLECENTYTWKIVGKGGSFGFVEEPDLFDVNYDTKRCLRPRTVEHTSFSSSYYAENGTGFAYYAVPTERGYWIDFYIRNLPAGKYNVYLNYRRMKNTASQKVNVYFRKASEAYDWKTQSFYSNLDMAFDDSSAEDDRMGVYPEFNQNLLLGEICKKVKITNNEGQEEEQKEALDYGDYVIRFVHADNRVAYYDNIILKPVQ